MAGVVRLRCRVHSYVSGQRGKAPPLSVRGCRDIREILRMWRMPGLVVCDIRVDVAAQNVTFAMLARRCSWVAAFARIWRFAKISALSKSPDLR